MKCATVVAPPGFVRDFDCEVGADEKGEDQDDRVLGHYRKKEAWLQSVAQNIVLHRSHKAAICCHIDLGDPCERLDRI